MQQPSDIAAALAAFDGTHTAPLKAVARDDLSPAAVQALVDAVPGPQEIAATWLIKALAEAGRLGAGTLVQVFERLPNITAADAALHILQCAQLAPDAAPLLRPHLSPYYGSKKILLRVWAFDAYCRGADPAEDLSERIKQGLTDRSAAMRARARALAREFGIDLENDP
ncbi:hypothetical protein [Gymnodinialimonas sp.]